ncbi:ABC transporter permease [Vagococcus sp.]|uniref:ABC transporter permease n=1 Tax=Vagococcus sp. TaxID=1933889 RepID=UPI003F9A68FD
MKKKRSQSRSTFLALLGLLIAWTLLSKWLNQSMLPSPLLVFKHLLTLNPTEVFYHLYNSLVRLFWGILLAVVVGTGIGLLMGRSQKWNQWLDPLVYLTYPIPKVALLPIFMLLFGLGDLSKIILIALIVVFQVILSVRDGVKGIPTSYYENYRVLGASGWQIFQKITLPNALSSVLSAIRVALGTAIAILFFTEVYGTQYGLGYFIMDAWGRLDYLDMYSGIFILSLVAFLLFWVIDKTEHFLLKWRQYT